MLNSCGTCPTAGVLPAVLIAGRPDPPDGTVRRAVSILPSERLRIANNGFNGCVDRKDWERAAWQLQRFLLDESPLGGSNSGRGQVVELSTVIDVTLR